MGGIIMFTAIAVPFLLLTDWDWRAVGVFGTAVACALLGFADDYTKLVKRRSLGLRGRTKLVVTMMIAVALFNVTALGPSLAEAKLLSAAFVALTAHVPLAFVTVMTPVVGSIAHPVPVAL